MNRCAVVQPQESDVARPSRPWFRFYVEALHDRKLRTRPPAQRWLWVTLMGMARSSPEPGTILVAENVPADVVVIADEAALTVKETEAGLEYYASLGMIHRDDRGAWVVASFLERQFESDTSTERTQLHRSKDVPSDSETPSQERSTSVSVSDSVSEVQKAASEAFDRFWRIYPRRQGKEAARKAFASALKRTDLETICAGAVQLRDDPNLEPQYTPHPATWLNQGRWDDDPLPSRTGLRRAAPPIGDRNTDRILRIADAASGTPSGPAIGVGV